MELRQGLSLEIDRACMLERQMQRTPCYGIHTSCVKGKLQNRG